MITDRLIKFIEYKGISKYKFYKITRISNGYLDKRSNIGSDKCEIISSCFPELSLEWLITGKGSMVKSDNAKDKLCGEVKKPPDRCELCLEKSKTIKHLEHCIETQKQTIDLQNKYIDDLRCSFSQLHKHK